MYSCYFCFPFHILSNQNNSESDDKYLYPNILARICRLSIYLHLSFACKAGKYSGPWHQWSQKFFWTPRKERGRKERQQGGKKEGEEEKERKREGEKKKGKEGENMKEDVKTKPRIKSSKRKKRNED